MSPAEAAAFLRQFNEWRRGDEDIPQPDPRVIGEAIDAAVEILDRLEAAESDAAHQKALADSALRVANGWERKCDALRAKIAEMEQQEPVGTLHDDGCFVWRETAPHQSNYAGWKMALYALPGAQGEEK